MVLLTAGAAAAQPADSLSPAAASPRRAARTTLNAVITLEDTELARPEVAAAVAYELGSELRVGPAPESAERYLAIRVSGNEATVEFHTPEGATVGRSVALPADRARALETIALLAANLVRNEAEELLEELARKADAARTSAGLTKSASATPDDGPKNAPPDPTTAPSDHTPPESANPPPKPAAPAPNTQVRRSASQKAPPPLIATDFNASLWHPLAVHRDSHRRQIHLELGLGYSRVGSIVGVAVTLGATNVHHGFRGIVATGLGSWATGDSEGIAASGFFTGGTGRFRGVQATGLFAAQLGPETRSIWDNWASGAHFEGVQWGAAANYVGGTMKGVQGTAVANVTTGPLRGVQFGAVNLTGERVDGFQAGGVNIDWFKKSEERAKSRGAQIGAVNAASSGWQGAQAGVANVVVGALDGAQLGAVNVIDARSAAAQIALVNVAADQTGAQLGLVNIAQEHTGMQIGLLNLATRSEGAFLGIASFAENIDTSLLAYSSTLSLSNVGIKSAVPWYFTRAAFGHEPTAASENAEEAAIRTSFAMGSHIGVGDHWFFDPGLEYSHMIQPNNSAGTTRHFVGPELIVGFKSSLHFGVFLGAAARMEGNDSWNPTAEGFLGVELL